MSGEEMRELYAAADELHVPERCGVPESELRSARGIEVGHIFLLGRKYTDAMNIDVDGADGKPLRVEMATFGIGVSRLLGAIIEASHDENGIIWPESVAPFAVGIINLRVGDAKCDEICKNLHDALTAQGKEVLYDDTEERAGAKFASMDLIGLPYQIVVGPKGAEKGVVELKNRKTGEKQEISIEQVVNILINKQ